MPRSRLYICSGSVKTMTGATYLLKRIQILEPFWDIHLKSKVTGIKLRMTKLNYVR